MGSIKKKILVWILLFCRKIELKIELFLFKRALKICPYPIYISYNFIKYNELLLGKKESIEGDNDIFLATKKIFNPEAFNKLTPKYISESHPKIELSNAEKSRYKNNKRIIDSLAKKYKGELKEYLKRYYLLRSYISEALKNNTRSEDYYFNKALDLDPKLKKYSSKDFVKVEKFLKKEHNKYIEKVKDERSIKIRLSYKAFVPFISVITPLFLLTGYLYNYFFWNNFGLDISKFFSVSDYISSSIDNIRYVIVSCLLPMISCYAGVFTSSRKYIDEREASTVSLNLPEKLILTFAILGAPLGYYINNNDLLVVSIFLLIVIAFTHYLIPVLSTKLFKNPIEASFLFLFILYFVSYLSFSIYSDIEDIDNKQFYKNHKHEVTLIEDNSEIEGYYFISANSSFYFFINKQKDLIIIPSYRVKSVRINKD